MSFDSCPAGCSLRIQRLLIEDGTLGHLSGRAAGHGRQATLSLACWGCKWFDGSGGGGGGMGAAPVATLHNENIQRKRGVGVVVVVVVVVVVGGGGGGSSGHTCNSKQ